MGFPKGGCRKEHLTGKNVFLYFIVQIFGDSNDSTHLRSGADFLLSPIQRDVDHGAENGTGGMGDVVDDFTQATAAC